MTSEIIHDHDVALLKDRHKDLVDIGLEPGPVYRAVDDAGGIDPIAAQGREKGLCSPPAMRRLSDDPAAAGSPAAQRRHIGLSPSLVNEHQSFGVKTMLVFFPAPTPTGDIRPVLFNRVYGFF